MLGRDVCNLELRVLKGRCDGRLGDVIEHGVEVVGFVSCIEQIFTCESIVQQHDMNFAASFKIFKGDEKLDWRTVDINSKSNRT